ncbi:MAG: ABC transporter permease [Planctomycetes bacterium]|nr:ABC transporter permease [Planctomycetota bacterium]
MSASPYSPPPARWQRLPIAIGGGARGALAGLVGAVVYVGGLTGLLGGVGQRGLRALVNRSARIRLQTFSAQCFRFGVRSIPIVILVQVFIGIILALNLAPTLELYGQLEQTATVVAIAVFRELGPLITAILLSGFAGASIAAELGAMVEGEEIKALRAHALDPIRFLVVPRVVSTAIMMIGLTVLADVVGVFGGFLTGVYVLDISPQVYIDLTAEAVGLADYLTGLSKSIVFGTIIAGLACYEGLHVRGGAEGVGRATTTTVVKSIVMLIGADCIFTAVFYVLEW